VARAPIRLYDAGMGETSDWYRNVPADPHVRVWVGRQRDVPGTVVELDLAVDGR
jgi:hypothetical protein